MWCCNFLKGGVCIGIRAGALMNWSEDRGEAVGNLPAGQFAVVLTGSVSPRPMVSVAGD